jgi:beta-lactamase class D
MKHLRFGIFFVIVLWLSACKSKARIDDRNEFAKYYSEYRLSGNFVMYDLKKDKYTYYNVAQSMQAYPPGATFKLFLSLVGFETGNIKTDEAGGMDNIKTTWNHEHVAKDPYQNSTVHYYDELTRKIGKQEIKG